MSLLPVKRNEKNRFVVATVHYSLDPEKNTPEWIEEAKRGMPERGWLREYEIDYSTYAGKAVFPEFTQYNIAPEKINYKEGEVLYRGWDFGFHRPMCIITKLNEFDQWCWIKVILGEDEGIKAFGERVRRYCLTTYPGAKYLDACDPAGYQMNDKSEETSIQVLMSLGIYPQARKQSIKQGIEIIRQKLMLRVDGKPGLLVDPGETMAIDGFKGGIHYPEPREGSSEKEFYDKDGFYDHIFDGARYLATELFTVIGQQQMANDVGMSDQQRKYAMGSPFTSSDYSHLEGSVDSSYGSGGLDEFF